MVNEFELTTQPPREYVPDEMKYGAEQPAEALVDETAVDDVDTTAVGASDLRDSGAKYDLPLADDEATAADDPADGESEPVVGENDAAEPVEEGEASEPPITDGSFPPGPPPNENPRLAEQPEGREPVDPGFRRFDRVLPRNFAQVPELLETAVESAIEDHADFVDMLETSAGGTVRVVRLESTEPDGGGRVHISVDAAGTINITGEGSEEMFSFSRHPAYTDQVIRESFSSDLVADLPEAGGIPYRVEEEVVGERVALERELIDARHAVGDVRVIGVPEMERATEMLARAVPRMVSLAEVDEAAVDRLSSFLTPEQADAQRAGSQFALDVENYLTRKGHEAGELAEEVEQVVTAHDTLTVQVGIREDIPLPAPGESLDGVEQLAISELPYVRLTYSQAVTPEMAEESRALVEQEAELPPEFTGGTIDVVLEFTRDQAGQLTGMRQVVYHNSDGSEFRSLLRRFVCDQTERRAVRNHINRPTIFERED